MNRIIPIAVAVLLAVSWHAMAALDHYITAIGAVAPSGAYTATWREASPGKCPPASACFYDLSVVASSTWQCYSIGTNLPQAQPYKLGPSTGKSPPNEPPHRYTSFAVTLFPDPGKQGCPGGVGKVCLLSISYSNVTLRDEQLNDTVDLPDARLDIAPPSAINPGMCR